MKAAAAHHTAKEDREEEETRKGAESPASANETPQKASLFMTEWHFYQRLCP